MKKDSQKRNVEIVVLSDLHLGTIGCKAKELLNYLKTIRPQILILNGDIIDIWQFNKRYFPTAHMKVIKHITSLLAEGTDVRYITGNHDEMLRRFNGFELGSFKIVNKVVLDLNGKKAWFFHGDVFDVTMKHTKWLAKLGGIGYDLLILINTLVNWCSTKLGRGRISFSKRIKDSVKGALKHINNFEETIADIAISNAYQYVVCGHIHHPQMRQIFSKAGQSVNYLNSGDWVENMTALEYNQGQWSLYQYLSDPVAQAYHKLAKEPETDENLNTKVLFEELVAEFNFDRLERKHKTA